MNGRIWDVAIIGGGPAGCTAALYCARAGLSALVIEQLSAGGQMATTTHIENYPGFEGGVDGFELAMQMQRQAEAAGAVTLYATVTAARLAVQPKQLDTTEGPITARTVMLAMGADPRRLGLADEQRLQGRGVAYCATCDGMFYKGKTVAVAGGGNSAAEDALVLSKLCQKVYIVHRRDTLRATKSYLDPLLKADNIEFVWNQRITGLAGESRLEALLLEDTQTGRPGRLAVDGLFVAIGRVPNTQLLAGQLPLAEGGYIPADETTRTALPGVFAIGDIRQKPLRQIVTAVADGATASKYAEESLRRQE